MSGSSQQPAAANPVGNPEPSARVSCPAATAATRGVASTGNLSRPANPPMDFTSALEDLINQALEDEDNCLSDIIFDLGQAQLSLHLTVLQAAADAEEGDL